VRPAGEDRWEQHPGVGGEALVVEAHLHRVRRTFARGAGGARVEGLPDPVPVAETTPGWWTTAKVAEPVLTAIETRNCR
jgi:hypothetical protein